MSLNEKSVVIVGGSSGIGLGVAEALLQEGATVTIVGRTQEKLRAAQESLGFGDRLKTTAADVTNEDQVRLLFEESGTIDHLVVPRGVAPIGAPIEALDLDAARRFIDVMLVSALSLIKHAAPHIRRGGSITFTSGISKDNPGIPGGTVVAAVAGSMGYLARALALELAPTRVNVVFLDHLSSARPLPVPELDTARQIVVEVKGRRGGAAEMCKLAVSWVALNPKPITLSDPD